MSIKNSNDKIGNRTRDLPACSAVPQPTAPLRNPEALSYKSEGRVFWPHYDPWIDSATNRNEYQEHFLGDKGARCLGLTTLPPRNLGASTSWDHHDPYRTVTWIA